MNWTIYSLDEDLVKLALKKASPVPEGKTRSGPANALFPADVTWKWQSELVKKLKII